MANTSFIITHYSDCTRHIEGMVRPPLEPSEVASKIMADVWTERSSLKKPNLPALLANVDTRARRLMSRLRKRPKPLALASDVESNESTPSSMLARKEMSASVLNAAHALDERERLVIEMRFYRSPALTYKQIAAQLGVSAPTIYRTLQEALRKLRKQLSPLGQRTDE